MPLSMTIVDVSGGWNVRLSFRLSGGQDMSIGKHRISNKSMQMRQKCSPTRFLIDWKTQTREQQSVLGLFICGDWQYAGLKESGRMNCLLGMGYLNKSCTIGMLGGRGGGKEGEQDRRSPPVGTRIHFGSFSFD